MESEAAYAAVQADSVMAEGVGVDRLPSFMIEDELYTGKIRHLGRLIRRVLEPHDR